MVTTYGKIQIKRYSRIREVGVKGVTVVAYDNKTNKEVGRTITDEKGGYLIPNLPNGDTV